MKRILVILLFVIGVSSWPAYAEIITHRWDGNTYVGEVKDGQLHGQGKYIGADGIKYEGQWKYSKFHGQGTLPPTSPSLTVALFHKQTGGGSAADLLKSLTGAASGSGGTTSVSGMTSGGSGNMADIMYKAYEKFPRGPAARYYHGKNEIHTEIGGALFLPANHPTVTYLQKVLTAVALHTHRPITYTGRYAVVVVEDESPNAYAGAGGIFYMATSMLSIIKDEDELAFLLAHELAHIELDHRFSQISDEAYAKIAADQMGMDISNFWNDETKQARWVMREEEADKRALELMALAGYNPSAGVKMAKRINSVLGKSVYHGGLTADTSRASRMKKIAKNLHYRDSGGFELRKKRFEQNMSGGVQTASSSVTSDTKKKKKKKSKSSVGDDK